MTKVEKYFYAALGSCLGASIALLLAPQTGAKTRKQLIQYGKKAGGRAQEFVSDIAESLDDVLGDILDVSESGLQKGKALTERARGEILEVLDAGKKYIEEERVKLDKIFK
jgi:gas vesicle protein